MKKILLYAAALFCAAITVSAQDDGPTTTWPYKYAEFMSGEIQKPTGGKQKGLFNFCLANSRLHFIDGDMVKEANMLEVFGLSIGADTYVNLEGKLRKVVSKSDMSMIVEGYDIDYAKMNSADGAYGSSGNTLSTQSLSSIEGVDGGRSNMNHLQLRNSKEDGQPLVLIVKKYIAFNNRCILANKKEVMDLAEAMGCKDETAAYIKSSKTKFSKVESLQELADFLSKFQK